MEQTINSHEGEWARTDERHPTADRARAGVSGLFLLNGTLMATWVSRIPTVQAAHGISNGGLGLALLALAGGAVVAMPAAGWLCARYGSGHVCRAATLIFCGALPLVAVAPGTGWLVAALAGLGVAHGALDVAMNAQAVALERQAGKAIMASFHALFSTGGLIGAGAGGLLAGWGLRPAEHFILMAGLFATVAVFIFPLLVEDHREDVDVERGTNFPIPSKGLVVLGLIALCCMMGEGAMADWTGVYLKSALGASDAAAAAGYAVFSLAMLVGRFSGDGLAARIAPERLVRSGGALAALGLAAALCGGGMPGALIGFACVGAGYATVVPTVFSAAGRERDVAPGVALASVTTLGYLGFLAGPPLIGFLAQGLGLRTALGAIVGTSLMIAILAGKVRRRG